MTTTKSVRVEFSGGLELLFSNQKSQTVEIPTMADDKPTNVNYLIHWLKDNLLKERGELFVDNDTVWVMHHFSRVSCVFNTDSCALQATRNSSLDKRHRLGVGRRGRLRPAEQRRNCLHFYPAWRIIQMSVLPIHGRRNPPLQVTNDHPVIHTVCRRGATAVNAPDFRIHSCSRNCVGKRIVMGSGDPIHSGGRSVIRAGCIGHCGFFVPYSP